MRSIVAVLVLACAVAIFALPAPQSAHYRWTLEVIDDEGNKEIVKGRTAYDVSLGAARIETSSRGKITVSYWDQYGVKIVSDDGQCVEMPHSESLALPIIDPVELAAHHSNTEGVSFSYSISHLVDGAEIVAPKNLRCQPVAQDANTVERRDASGVKCEICKGAIGAVLGRICSGAGAAACSAFPPAVPFCSVLAGAACGKISLPKTKACEIIRQCP